jgi:predicted DNA-binding transcriptional regulator YafY
MKRDRRLYDLVQIMCDGQLHTASELAETLGVSDRTIWRDMSVMAASGIPVEGDADSRRARGDGQRIATRGPVRRRGRSESRTLDAG